MALKKDTIFQNYFKESEILKVENKKIEHGRFNFQFLVFLIFLLIILLNQHNLFKSKNNRSEELFDDLVIFDGIECAFTYKLEKHVKMWLTSHINISYNPSNNCSHDILSRLQKDGGATFRLQAYSVYEMTTATSVYIGNNTYQIYFRLSFPTRYIVMIFLTYVNNLAMESREHTKPILKQLPGSPFEIGVFRSPSPKDVARYCKRSESGLVSGRWIKCGGAINGLERCGAWQSSDFDFDHIHGFRWVPYVCQYHQYTNDQMKKCFARNRWSSIVFAGDSHMRYRAYHWATRLYGSCHACVKTHIKMVFDKVPRIEWVFDARGTRLPLSFKNISLPYEKYIHPKVRRSKFSTPFPDDALDSRLFLLNFGHWILREINDRDFITKKLIAYAQAAKYLIDSGRTVVWVNTVSLPWRTDQAVIDWRENTSPFRVRELNKLAESIMEHHGIPTVDAFKISDSRIAATHDQTHYTKKLAGNDFGGVVENAITNVILNLLCNER